MKRVDEDFKKEFDKDYREGMYVVRKVGLTVVAVVVAVTVIGGIGGVAYKATIGKADKNVEREVFKESVAYNEQAASFLAKSYKEYNEADSDADKKAVMEYVVMRYPNLDTDSIENDKLKQFYLKCFNN